ncbi:DUF5666 domain-containing protein [Marinobacter sp. CHS3-4]|uniref:DUF5666 domain-containing protein n=1 Tax=Marinobacter sp. CHS3-4 TaxID=3045174 RepID=UPI0024B4EAF6|nr:DUF5666 domain-containing protein [Marinobacter sp. CHS3-4]MDI9244559.1 DUF5666 domain-containing protein [Marinobacter sp. CHS3-4]
MKQSTRSQAQPPVQSQSQSPAHRWLLGLAGGLVVLGTLSACGGGTGAGGLDVAEGGIRGTGSSVGPVSGFGSVFLNGVEFSTDGILNRAVESDDGISTESELSEGMILRIEGQWLQNGQGVADEMHYDDTLRGPIDAIAPDSSGEFVTLTVMGQTVRVDRQTVIRGTTYTNLLAGSGVGDHVRVSAWRQADGTYRAGYVGVLAPDLNNIELEGSVSSVDTSLDQFSIGTITVEYDDGTVMFGSGLTEADLNSAEVLEVEGSLSGNTLFAVSIDRDDARRFRRGGTDDIELTATISSSYTPSGAASLPGEFTVGDLTIQVTSATELEDGLDLADLTAGVLVQVEGEFLSDSLVMAEEIEFREGNSKVKGVVSSIDNDRLFIGGVEVRVTSSTILVVEDGTDVSLATLPVGSTTVEVEGVETEQGADVFIRALKMEVDSEAEDLNDRNQFELEGQLRDISQIPGTISILGVRMNDNGADYDNVPRGTIVTNFQNDETVVLDVEYTGSVSGFSADRIKLEESEAD